MDRYNRVMAEREKEARAEVEEYMKFDPNDYDSDLEWNGTRNGTTKLPPWHKDEERKKELYDQLNQLVANTVQLRILTDEADKAEAEFHKNRMA